MSDIDTLLAHLQPHIDTWRAAYRSSRPFPWVVMDDFLPADFAERLQRAFPPPEAAGWSRTSYVHQRKKLTMTSGLPDAHAAFFALSAAPRFLAFISELSGIETPIADPALVGGGLHQSLPGAFLDVHVDYNLHPTEGWHRRLNLLLYMNRSWQPEWNGALELWDMQKHQRLCEIAPVFNRAVLFETNALSYHGHPEPLACPEGESRKSLAVYYFSAAPAGLVESNTVYRQTTGLPGYLKTARAALVSAQERLRSQGVVRTAQQLGAKLVRRLAGLPPKNG